MHSIAAGVLSKGMACSLSAAELCSRWWVQNVLASKQGAESCSAPNLYQHG